MKNKTLAVWLTLLGGPLGLHRLYLHGKFDSLAFLQLLPTLVGGYGVLRAREIGLDDQLSWALSPLLGFSVAAAALTAIVYGLMASDQWNQRFNPTLSPDHAAGQAGWLTVGGLVVALLLGATVLLSSIAFTFQRYFEYQSENPAVVAAPPATKKSAG